MSYEEKSLVSVLEMSVIKFHECLCDALMREFAEQRISLRIFNFSVLLGSLSNIRWEGTMRENL